MLIPLVVTELSYVPDKKKRTDRQTDGQIDGRKKRRLYAYPSGSINMPNVIVCIQLITCQGSLKRIYDTAASFI
jgi:hypothetical protein